MTFPRLASLLALSFLAACATVKNTRLRGDYDQTDRQKVKRLVVVTQPLPEGKQSVGDLWSLLARRYVNQKREFLARSQVALAGAPQDPTFKALCVDGAEGILWLQPTLERKGKGVETSVKAQLLRCTDGQEIWGTEAAGSWDSEDKKFLELKAQYVEELGAEVGPYVAPSFQVLKAALDTLPNPTLTEEDISEKIELGE